MQAVLLAGGKGTRLKPYTISFPKPLVPLGEYPIIEVIIRQLHKAGINEIIISTGHLAGLIEAYCGDGSKWGVKIRYVREDKPLNTAGALKLVQGLEDHFLVMNGDILTNLDYRTLIKQHLDKKAAATVAVRTRESKIDFGVVDHDAEGFLTHYTEKPVYKFLVSMGVYVMSKAVLDLIAVDEAIGMPDLLLRIKAKGGKVFCMQTECSWLDIGRVDDYENAQETFASNAEAFLPSK
jgi:NDP-sugar pyrophosphorylase family protein